VIVIGWGKPDGYEPCAYHAILEINPRGSIVTACGGRWAFSDAWELLLPGFFHPPLPEHIRRLFVDPYAGLCGCCRRRVLARLHASQHVIHSTGALR
jgi:hypothetical protein